MKRSEYIAIGSVGLLAVAAFWPRNVTSVGGSTEEAIAPDAQIFASAQECRTAPGMTLAACDAAFTTAEQTATAKAPRFNDQASCEAQYGASQCRTSTWNGASVFVPALIGVLVGRSLANAGQAQGQAQSQPLYPPRTGPANCPQGAGTPNRPDCAQQGRSGGGSTGGGFGRAYSTGAGTVVSRTSGTDARARVDARPRSSGMGSGGTSTNPGTGSGSNTVSRSGFGSTGQSMSSGG